MTTVATPARTASSILCPPNKELRKGASHAGALWLPRTLSRITFSGHGAARDIAVSASIASKIITIQPRYGLSSSRVRRILPPAGASTDRGDARVTDGTLRRTPPRSFDRRGPPVTGWQCALEGCPSGFIGHHPHFSAVGFNDRTADRQSHSHPLRLGGVERRKQPMQIFRFHSRTRILHGDHDVFCLIGVGTN